MKIYSVSTAATTARTAIFTVGHFLIDMITIMSVTGSAFEAAAQASVVAPLANAVWFWFLDRAWTHWHHVKEDMPMMKVEGVK